MSMAQLVVAAVVVEALSKSERDTPPFSPPLPGNAAAGRCPPAAARPVGTGGDAPGQGWPAVAVSDS
jgi:hypothetical protein